MMRKIILQALMLGSFYLSVIADNWQGDTRQTMQFNQEWEFRKIIADSITTWEKITIPHTWNNLDMQTRHNNFYAGEAHYKKEFIPDNDLRDRRVFIHFEGIASEAEIFLNGNFAGNHAGAYSAYCVEITGLLKFGVKNEILVKANNSSKPDIIPVNHVLFGVYGGIYRPVKLISTSKINISLTDYASSGIYITQNRITQQSADISLKIKLENKTTKIEPVFVKTSVLDAEGRTKISRSDSVSLSAQGSSHLLQNITVQNPHLWQGIEDPYLYKVRVTLTQNGKVLDEKDQTLGLRKIEMKTGKGVFLNGKKINMYGVCRHQDWWQLGSALSEKNHDKDLSLIKELGATTLRLAHYQQSEYFYSKCDSMGFLVWAEIPFVNKVTTKEANNAKQQLTELIRQNYNHPSIFVWGLGNEVYKPSNYVISLFQELNDLAKTEDPGRYTVQVSGYNKVDQEVNNNADIQGINQYFGWYNGTLDSMKTWVERVEKQFPDSKVIFSEYGAEANVDLQRESVSNRGDCCGFKKDYNESFSTRFHEEHWKVISEHPYLLASYIWNMFDFATPMSSQGQVYARNMKGLVTFDRNTKKDPFYWYKANWSKEAVLYITQRRVVNRSRKITPVAVYSNRGIPKLKVNGKFVGNCLKGATDVHFIFQDVELRNGKNIIEVFAEKNGKKYHDLVIWNYSKENKQDQDNPDVRLNEHIGL